MLLFRKRVRACGCMCVLCMCVYITGVSFYIWAMCKRRIRVIHAPDCVYSVRVLWRLLKLKKEKLERKKKKKGVYGRPGDEKAILRGEERPLPSMGRRRSRARSVFLSVFNLFKICTILIKHRSPSSLLPTFFS